MPADPHRALEPNRDPEVQDIDLHPGQTVVGLLGACAQRRPALVVVSSDGGSLLLVNADGREHVHRTEHPIAQCSVHPDPARIALLTKARTLVVLDAAAPAVAPLLVVPDVRGPSS